MFFCYFKAILGHFLPIFLPPKSSLVFYYTRRPSPFLSPSLTQHFFSERSVSWSRFVIRVNQAIRLFTWIHSILSIHPNHPDHIIHQSHPPQLSRPIHQTTLSFDTPLLQILGDRLAFLGIKRPSEKNTLYVQCFKLCPRILDSASLRWDKETLKVIFKRPNKFENLWWSCSKADNSSWMWPTHVELSWVGAPSESARKSVMFF